MRPFILLFKIFEMHTKCSYLLSESIEKNPKTLSLHIKDFTITLHHLFSSCNIRFTRKNDLPVLRIEQKEFWSLVLSRTVASLFISSHLKDIENVIKTVKMFIRTHTISNQSFCMWHNQPKASTLRKGNKSEGMHFFLHK